MIHLHCCPSLFRPFAKRLYSSSHSKLGGANFAGHTADASSNHRTAFHGSMVKILRPRALQENRVQVAPLVTREAN
ncbi:hypothetical protein B296_00037413 [Ensete ventricosum]|uniref:Uncharacterized protein n=1 Tax=Ensete ventricosum TaxID=4639 RepID=A0A426YMJ4_ENSVE|nr:hypothetical protein B296_00037413 [Ensete ventricosum]